MRIIANKDMIDEVFAQEAKRLKAFWDGREPMEIVLRKAHSRRTLTQNAQLHAMFEDMAGYFSSRGTLVTADRMKDLMKYKFLGTEDVVVGNTTIPGQLRSTAKLDVGEMSHFISEVMDWCFDHGVPVRNPHDGEYMQRRKESTA